MHLTLIRHAQTHSNVTRALDTTLPGADLTELGEEEVDALTSLLAAERIDAVFCSPALRTRRTAAGIAAQRGLDLQVRDGLVEIAAGDWEMSTEPADAEAYRAYVVRWLEGDPEARVPGGESGREVLGRFAAVIEEIRGSGLSYVVLVSHGAVLRTWCGARVDNVSPTLVAEHPLGNTGLVRLHEVGDAEPGGWVATYWDQDLVEPGGEPGPASAPL